MSSKSAKFTLVKNKKHDCLYHKESMLIFKSATEKLVIGRIDDDKVVPLDEKALELCEEYGFKYDETLVETEDAGEEPEEEAVEEPAPEKVEEKHDTKVKEPEKSSVLSEQEVKPVKGEDPFVKGFAVLVQKHSKELQEFLLENKPEDLTEKVAELEKQVSSLKKELEDTKKKLKGVLAAMQGDL
jgi:hypothetical protein